MTLGHTSSVRVSLLWLAHCCLDPRWRYVSTVTIELAFWRSDPLPKVAPIDRLLGSAVVAHCLSQDREGQSPHATIISYRRCIHGFAYSSGGQASIVPSVRVMLCCSKP